MCTYLTKIFFVTKNSTYEKLYKGRLGLGFREYDTVNQQPLLASFNKVSLLIKTSTISICVDGKVVDSWWSEERQKITVEIGDNQLKELLDKFDFTRMP